MYDIIIIGGGPAGLTAALYARRANKNVLLIEKETFGGQITFSPKVENIPGFESVSGNEFAEKLVDQVLAQGAEVESATVLSLEDGDVKKVITDDGEYEAKTVIIATGSKHRVLGLEGEDRFIGNGISFCAVCDGAFYTNKTVAVVGGGNSALQEAILLSELASKVYIVQNLDFLTGEKALQDQVYSKANIEVIEGVVVKKLIGENDIEGIDIYSEKKDETRRLDVDGVFYAVGLEPQNGPFSDIVALDGAGYVDCTEDCLAGREGIFAAGDCRKKKVRQVATAASDGAIAALAACNYIDSMDQKLS